jgi:DNA-binding GntR family transcriptional regulator
MSAQRAIGDRGTRARRIERPALHHEVVEHLRDLITDGTLAAGERLNERALCEIFGISRTPLREALLVLQGEGLVELTPRRGARVREMGSEEVRDLLELLGGIEALAGELACARATAADIEEIRAQHAVMLEHYERNEMLAYFKRNESIHDLIVAATGNAELIRTHALLRQRALRARYIPNARPERWRAAVQEHEAFVAALEARDGARLGRLLRRHMKNTWQELERWLEASPAAIDHPGDPPGATRRRSVPHPERREAGT